MIENQMSGCDLHIASIINRFMSIICADYTTVLAEEGTVGIDVKVSVILELLCSLPKEGNHSHLQMFSSI